MENSYLNLYLHNSRIKENPYDRKRELASKFLKNLGLVSAGGYMGSVFSDNFYLGMIFLTLALGSAGVRHYFLEQKK